MPALLGTNITVSTGAWIAVAIVLALAGGFVVTWIRRWARNCEPVATFTLQDLRDMRAEGQISKDEFELLRRRIIRSAAVDLPGPDLNGAPPGGGGRAADETDAS